MAREFSDTELEAYLDEDLSSEEMGLIESAIREPGDAASAIIERLTQINRRRDSGVHSLGEIWRNRRASCPTREQFGSFLLGVLSKEEADYIEFHVHQLGCRQCQANLEDLRSQQGGSEKQASTERRRKYFQTSAGYLKKDEP